jgi:hypothetical protein
MLRGRWDGIRRPGTKYRSTIEARRAFKLQCLEDLAESLDDGLIGGRAGDYALTEEQAASVRRELARTLRTRAARGGYVR